MEARFMPAVVLLAVAVSLGAGYRTANFIIEAPTPQLAQKIGKAAEQYRRDLAVEWLGTPMPNWSRPCPIVAEVAPHLGAGGATSFVFNRGEVFGWDMKIQGSEQRVLDSVLPHEVTHTIFASHFRRPLPRWADEGACTSVEHVAERKKQQHMLVSFLRTGKGIAFHQMFAMREYPHDVLPLYSQGYSLARFLIEQGGRRKFLEYVGDGMKNENWSAATKKHYDYDNLAALQNKWLDWVKQGSPPLDGGRSDELLAANNGGSSKAREPIYRAQSEDRDDAATTKLASLAPARSDSADVPNHRTAPTNDRGWTTGGPNNARVSPRSAGRVSVYDRRPVGPDVPEVMPPAPIETPPQRGPELLARHDDVSPKPPEHRVLLEWTRPTSDGEIFRR